MKPTHTLQELIQKKEDHIHLWRFVAGVVFALDHYDLLSKRYPSSAKPRSYKSESLNLLRAISAGAEPPGNWQRGFFYNSAIMRLDAAWERSIHAILNSPETKQLSAKQLWRDLRRIEPSLPAYDKSKFKPVRDEVNALKHDVGGAPEPIRERPDVLREGLEALLLLLERRFLSGN